MTTAIVCSAILGASIFALGFNVSRLRGATAKSGGSQMPDDPASPLLIAVRAHGNATEYVPTLMLLFLLVAWLVSSPWATGVIIAATVSRLVHAGSMLSSPSLAQESHLRLAGAVGTYLFGMILAVTAVIAAL